MPQQEADARAVIFDVDGVLLDSYHAHFEAWRLLGHELGQDLTEQRFAASFGRRNAELMHDLWGGAVPENEVDGWGDWKEVAYREILLREFPAMDGALDLIDALKAARFRLAVGSSGPPENVACALDGLGRGSAFDATVNGSEVACGKPHPEVFLKAAEKLGIDPARCAVVEDAPAGVEAAARAGMAPIALTGTAPRERFIGHAVLVVDSLRELSPARIAEFIDRPR